MTQNLGLMTQNAIFRKTPNPGLMTQNAVFRGTEKHGSYPLIFDKKT